LLAPAGLTAAPLGRLEPAIARALATPEVREQFSVLSLDPAPMPSREYAAFLRDEIQRWRKVVTMAKLKPL
jgi:tripartite-type tricarboxylate transporter receptor subunit TctC